MSLQVEKLEHNMAKLTIEVDADKFVAAMKTAYNKEKGKMNIPGFRKGKVPMAYLEKMYGPEMFYEEAANTVINNEYPAEVMASGLEVVSQPEIDVVEAEPGKYVEERIYDYLNEMFAAAREEGVYPIIRDAYRSKEEQQRIMKNKVTAYKNEGYPEFLARRYAKDWVAEPGKSEHQLGLAVDINADKTLCTNEMVYAWLAKHAHQYGFILRYPKEKELPRLHNRRSLRQR